MENISALPALLSIAEFAAVLRIGLSTAKAIVARGEVESITIGRRRMVPGPEVQRYIEGRLAAARLTAPSSKT
jgi:excisionase family DNA binding protein